MDKAIDKKLDTKNIVSSGNEIQTDVLVETLSSHNEKISKVVSENGGSGALAGSGNQKFQFLTDISQKIAGLLSTSQKQKIETIPSRKNQEKALMHELEREKKSLLHDAKRVENSKNFSADSLEQLMYRLRNIQSLISNLLYMASDKIESLYKKYVLKKG